jgi:hypothetical protein
MLCVRFPELYGRDLTEIWDTLMPLKPAAGRGQRGCGRGAASAKLNGQYAPVTLLCAREAFLPDQKQDETFRVIDRRLFNPDGEIRDEKVRDERQQRESEPAPAPAAAAKQAAVPASAEASSASIAAVPEAGGAIEGKTAGQQVVEPEGPPSSRGLEMLINFVAQNAAMLLGAYPDPRTGQPMLDLEGARELIDMLDALRETTRGNLSQDDDRLLLDVLGQLKLSFMEMTKAAAKAMKDQAKARP